MEEGRIDRVVSDNQKQAGRVMENDCDSIRSMCSFVNSDINIDVSNNGSRTGELWPARRCTGDRSRTVRRGQRERQAVSKIESSSRERERDITHLTSLAASLPSLSSLLLLLLLCFSSSASAAARCVTLLLVMEDGKHGKSGVTFGASFLRICNIKNLNIQHLKDVLQIPMPPSHLQASLEIIPARMCG